MNHRINKRELKAGGKEDNVDDFHGSPLLHSENNPSSHQLPARSPQQQLSCNTQDPKPHRVHPSRHQQPLGLRYIRQVSGPLNPSMGVNLRFSHDLNTMTQNWTREEFASSRRLVKFEFHDSENAIQTVSFQPVTSQASDNSGPIISCIYWKEKDRHIATSVDIILILEYLVNQSFGIEEKNRIRRNLQSLKPTTVSRSNKEDCDFFNLIMSMENPRPRNIEKDLKVFNWGDLGKAIAKVMSKYSVISPHGQIPLDSQNHSNSRFGKNYDLVHVIPNSPSMINNDSMLACDRPIQPTNPMLGNSYERQAPQFQYHGSNVPLQIPLPPVPQQIMYPSVVTPPEHYQPFIPFQQQPNFSRFPHPPGTQVLPQPMAPPHFLQHRPQVENESVLIHTTSGDRSSSQRMNHQFVSTPMRTNYFSTQHHPISSTDINSEEYRISLGIGNDSNSSVSSCNTDFPPEENLLNKQQEKNNCDTLVCEKPPEPTVRNKLPSISQILNSDIQVTCLSLPPIETGERLPSVSKIESWKTS
ncbi:uncharacterized protein SPAPADRAFT_51373 [Spathaspora passalidarum NRRL Y-27907]|uniref:DUF7082 domain-containing protein n=1 Tax=Spathaspora passalidarum (strain NRRL Y-27907 / 11-Y1) TaxID=619300 RepID=G3ART8_SPAPN|nr:uncharacterized protein SPAPADRAFT_51373 [Spathaspora passalidarum NRRL Y-27907]EGW31355.1 hypothetical protein SPAPADRAFT_51373 [Spathaspora passalidarum NRRL Y-27907]